MREYNIKIEPYNFIDILELKIHKEINEHVTAIVRGHISEENINKYTGSDNSGNLISIYAVDEEGQKKILFKGIIKDIKESIQSELAQLSIKAVSGTVLCDITRKTRTFQDGSMTYNDVLNRVISEENGSITINQFAGDGKSINEFIVQFNETNWEFMKRLASHWNSYLVPDYKLGGCEFYFGNPHYGNTHHINETDYSIEKDIDQYRLKKQNHVPSYEESDSLYYLVKSREVYDLCENVTFKNRKLCIVEIDTELTKGELIHTYKMQSANGSRVPKYYNYKIIGSSLESSITEVSKDNVKVKINIDNGRSKSLNRWFSYSTVYSSPDGTGWYFMPEKGDSVRIYFPSEKEDDAFAISSVHEAVNSAGGGGTSSGSVSSGSQAPRSNPDSKSLSTKYGKQINFNPDNIEIIAGDNLFITITDGEGIVIKSDNSITLDAKEDINVSSKKNLLLAAQEGITIAKGSEDGGEQGKIEISEDNEITLTGKDIKINQ